MEIKHCKGELNLVGRKIIQHFKKKVLVITYDIIFTCRLKSDLLPLRHHIGHGKGSSYCTVAGQPPVPCVQVQRRGVLGQANPE